MDDRTRIVGAVCGTVSLFALVQLGALALVEPFILADAQPVEDPSDPRNSLLFFGAILVATAAMLAGLKYASQRVIRGFLVLACGALCWFVVDTLMAPLAAAETEIGVLDTTLSLVAVLGPLLAGLAVVAGLAYYPEWYVIDAAGVVMGAGAAGLFGISFGPFPAIVFLVVLAVYDAISVYGTKHMLTLAEGVMDMRVPVLLVVPTTFSYSFLDEGGDDTNEATDSAADEENDPDAESVRDAIYIGLGDAVMPSILVVSAAAFLPDVAPIDVPGIALTLPALTAMLGTLVGLVVLLWMVLKGRAHAGLPLLNGGAILGYLLGALVAGLTLVEAIGLPL